MEILVEASLFCLMVTSIIVPLIVIATIVQQKEFSKISRWIITVALIVTYGPTSLIASLFLKERNIRKLGKISLYVFIISSAILLGYFNLDAYMLRQSSIGGIYASIAAEGIQRLILKLLMGLFVFFEVV